jgi:hypothetical protein
MSTKITWLGLGLLGCALAACGDDADGDACAPVVACGGDIVGTWQVESICISDSVRETYESELPPECAGSYVRADAELGDATLEYTADGVLTSAGSATAIASFRFSEACLLAADETFPGLSEASCAALEDSVELALASDDPSVQVSCELGDGACECETRQLTSTMASGTYTVEDDQIVVGGQALDYCVSGDELRYSSPLFGVATAHRR